MSEQKELYRVNSKDDSLNRQINLYLQRIADRLDKIEGRRGNPKFYSATFEFNDGNVLMISGDYHVTQSWEGDYT